MKRVKLIRTDLNKEDYGYYQVYLKEFIQQDITILSLNERACDEFSGITTIIYECNEFFTDKTGTDSVKILSEGFGKKARIVIDSLENTKLIEYK